MYCNTSENATDIFTKPLGKIKFELFREMLGVEFNPFSIKRETCEQWRKRQLKEPVISINCESQL